MSQTFVLGDIHGNYSGLVQCLEQSKFDIENDELIILGDVIDRGDDSFRCVELLLKIKDLILIRGSHEIFILDRIKTNIASLTWLVNGGDKTLQSYGIEDTYKFEQISKGTRIQCDIPLRHRRFYESSKRYYVEENSLFVHAAFSPDVQLKNNSDKTLLWDRTMFENMERTKTPINNTFENVFIGHTPTINFGTTKPINIGNLWNLDTGSGYKDGLLTLMNVSTKEYWQSK